MLDLIIFVVFLGGAYFVGTFMIEKKHYRSILERERNFLSLPAVTARTVDHEKEIADACLVSANVVVSIDYFKRFLGGLRNIFGGQMSSYEPVLDRARREAILRIKELAPRADIILNLRVETSTIGKSYGRRQGIGCSEVLAYGTAVTYKK